jgi:hypothetical protein
MSGQPFGDPKSNPYSAPALGSPPSESPELLSKANSAFNLAIGGIAISFLCCCGIGGVIMGVIATNNAGGVLALAPAGSEANSKAASAKTLGIVAIVIGAIQVLGGMGFGVVSSLNR